MEHFQDTFHSGKTGTIVAIMFSLYTVSVSPTEAPLLVS